MEVPEMERILVQNFPFQPTPSQRNLFHALARFLLSQMPNCLLMVKGYAGTGKTTTVNSLVKSLSAINAKPVLLAPTGRAAKVMSGYTGYRAMTIHKKIYFLQTDAEGHSAFVLGKNLHKNAVFVVDEASMIGWVNHPTTHHKNLLLDLFTYVFGGHNCKLILIGDGAQLPPVGDDYSPALDLKFLKSEFELTAAVCELTEVMRQSDDSGILSLATHVRDFIQGGLGKESLPIVPPNTPDVVLVSGVDLQTYLEDVFTEFGAEGTVLVSRSNKRCNLFNQAIRNRVFFREEEVSTGDLIMAVKNNYHWLGPESKAGFIANGDVMEIVRIGREEEMYGFHFLYVTVRMIDYPDEIPVELMIWVDSISVEGASMPYEASREMYQSARETYMHLPTKGEQKKAIKEDPYLNAVQIKFAYAVTCHKSQGGQWPAVFVDQGYLTDELLDENYYRWLYTAMTRATQRLFLVNFSPFLIQSEEE